MTDTTCNASIRRAPAQAAPAMTSALTLQFAAAVGVIVLPLFAPQPLVGLIGPSLGLSPNAAGLIAMLTQLGYAAGLFLLVPLTDLIENRRLILATLIGGVIALAAAALAPSPPLFLAAALAVGITTSAIQMLVPLAAMLTPEAKRGQVIGNVMSGLMVGILLSRPIASLAAEASGWRGAYALDAAVIAVTAIALLRVLPRRVPPSQARYGALIASLWTLLKQEPVLRRSTAAAGLCMGAFSVFWTAVALRLAAPPFNLGQTGIAFFALAGTAGAVIATIAGWAGDRGWTRPATRLAHIAVITAMTITGIAGAGWFGFEPAAWPGLSLGLMAMAAVLLDVGVIVDQTLGRRQVNLLQPEARGRLNGLFTGLFFLGGGAGAALAGLAWAQGGWTLVCLTGIGFGAAALSLALTGGGTDCS